MSDHMEQLADRMAALEREYAVLKHNNAKLTEKLRHLDSTKPESRNSPENVPREIARHLAAPQPPPRQGHTRVLDVCTEWLAQRTATGKEKYGTELEAGNGRDALVDAIQESGDLFQYLVQVWIEQQQDAQELSRLTTLRRPEEWRASDGVVLWWHSDPRVPPVVALRRPGRTGWTPLPKVKR